MRKSFGLIRLMAMVCVVVAFSEYTIAQEQFVRLSGAACATPPALHCPDKDCPSDRIINPGRGG